MNCRIFSQLSCRSNLCKYFRYSRQIGNIVARNNFSILNIETFEKTIFSNVNFQKNFIRQFHKSYFLFSLPNHTKVNLPALSPTMELGTIVSWQKKEGDQLSEGDLLCEIETDKATMGFETPEEGYLAKVFFQEGSKDIPIGQLLCIIVENKEDIDAFKNFVLEPSSPQSKPSTVPPTSAPSVSPLSSSSINQSVSSPSSGIVPTVKAAIDAVTFRIKATPYAKKVAAENRVDLSKIDGSGPSGRIIAKDIDSTKHAIDSTSTASKNISNDYSDIPLSNMRKTIAKRLSESKRTIPHYYLTSEIVIDNLLSIRAQLNQLLLSDAEKSGNKPVKISINDFIIKASALSCLRVPEANSFFMENFIRQNNNVDVSVAVSTDSGLITPIVFNAHYKGVATISSEVSSLAAKARKGKLQPHEFQGGTFTISNLGMFGSVDHFTAIINPPQSCILAVGGAKKKLIPVNDENEHCVVTALKVTLSCDHRVVDGAVGAVWLKHFKSFLEHPHSMLL